MDYGLSKCLASMPAIKVVRALTLGAHPMCLRELVSVCGLSVGGVADILRRLSNSGILSSHRVGNRKCYELQISDRERALMQELETLYDESQLKERAVRFGKNAAEKLKWMDETYSFFQEVKERNK